MLLLVPQQSAPPGVNNVQKSTSLRMMRCTYIAGRLELAKAFGCSKHKQPAQLLA